MAGRSRAADARHYGGVVNVVDFRHATEMARLTINRWVADKTRQKIRELIPVGGLDLERAGVSRSVTMQRTGHKTEAVYRRYAIVSEGDLSAGVEKLAGLSSGTIGGTKKRKGRVARFRQTS